MLDPLPRCFCSHIPREQRDQEEVTVQSQPCQESKKEKKKKEAEDKPEGDAGDAALAGEEADIKKRAGLRR